jgi:hypothetical protein
MVPFCYRITPFLEELEYCLSYSQELSRKSGKCQVPFVTAHLVWYLAAIDMMPEKGTEPKATEVLEAIREFDFDSVYFRARRKVPPQERIPQEGIVDEWPNRLGNAVYLALSKERYYYWPYGAFFTESNECLPPWNEIRESLELSDSLVGGTEIGPLVGAIGEILSADFSTLIARLKETHLPHLARGGIVTKQTKVIVGEAGPEAIIPLKSLENNPIPCKVVDITSEIIQRIWAGRLRQKKGAKRRNKARNAWICAQKKQGRTLQEILDLLPAECLKHDWECVTTVQAIHHICISNQITEDLI